MVILVLLNQMVGLVFLVHWFVQPKGMVQYGLNCNISFDKNNFNVVPLKQFGLVRITTQFEKRLVITKPYMCNIILMLAIEGS